MTFIPHFVQPAILPKDPGSGGGSAKARARAAKARRRARQGKRRIYRKAYEYPENSRPDNRPFAKLLAEITGRIALTKYVEPKLKKKKQVRKKLKIRTKSQHTDAELEQIIQKVAQRGRKIKEMHAKSAKIIADQDVAEQAFQQMLEEEDELVLLLLM